MAQFEMQTFLRLTSISTEFEITQLINNFKVLEPSFVEADALAAQVLAVGEQAEGASKKRAVLVSKALTMLLGQGSSKGPSVCSDAWHARQGASNKTPASLSGAELFDSGF